MSYRALIALVGTLSLSAGCLNGFDAGSDDGGSTDDAGPAVGADYKADFYAKVAPILGGPDGHGGACGACHSKSDGVGPNFMDPSNPDMLTKILSFPALIGETPEKSRI